MLTNARQLLHVELLFVNVLLAFDLTFPNFSAHLLSSADAFCQILVDTLEGTPGLRYIWSTFKPLLQGKVLYAPDTPAARLLVKEVGSEQKKRERKNMLCCWFYPSCRCRLHFIQLEICFIWSIYIQIYCLVHN